MQLTNQDICICISNRILKSAGLWMLTSAFIKCTHSSEFCNRIFKFGIVYRIILCHKFCKCYQYSKSKLYTFLQYSKSILMDIQHSFICFENVLSIITSDISRSIGTEFLRVWAQITNTAGLKETYCGSGYLYFKFKSLCILSLTLTNLVTLLYIWTTFQQDERIDGLNTF